MKENFMIDLLFIDDWSLIGWPGGWDVKDEIYERYDRVHGT
jgi:hypothetical protein